MYFQNSTMAAMRRSLSDLNRCSSHLATLAVAAVVTGCFVLMWRLNLSCFCESGKEFMKPALNLVLCGRRGAGKTSAAKAILGLTELHSVNPSVCVKNEGEVCGRQVSVVEMPALREKPMEVALDESLNCITGCDPEGVHAFFLVLPVGPLTEEDKKEFETIQQIFSSPVNNFIMILFTVESGSARLAVDDFRKQNKDIQELCQSCEGRYVALNISDEQQIHETRAQLLKAVDRISDERSSCFTKETFTKAQMFARIETERQSMREKVVFGGNKDKSLRMVLIGKTGGGKGATANTILGKKHFQSRVAPKPANKTCEPATGEIDGRPVLVVNTPGLFDTTLTEDEIQLELGNCVSLVSPGPHVFLVVLQIGNITKEEKDSVELIKKVWGKKAGDYIILLFTRAEELESQTFESYIQECDSSIKKLFNDCGGRYQLFNNKATDRKQVRELLTKIDTMVRKNGGSCYNTELLGLNVEQIQLQIFNKRQHEELEKKVKELEAQLSEMKNKQEEKSQQELKEEVRKLKQEMTDIKRKHEKKSKCSIQ